MVLPFQLIFSWNRTWAWLPPLGTLCDRGANDMMDWWLQMGKALLHAVLVLFNTQFVWFSTLFLLLTRYLDH